MLRPVWSVRRIDRVPVKRLEEPAMPNVFQVGEIVNIGIEDEVTGVALYAALAEKAKSDLLKRFYAAMTEKERVHERKFRNLLAQVNEREIHESFVGEYDAYLRAMLDARAFPTAEVAVRKVKAAADDRAGLSLALQMEKDTLALFLELVKFMPERHRPVVEGIIEEERSHVVELSAQVRALKS
jgi:rubrerythrin